MDQIQVGSIVYPPDYVSRHVDIRRRTLSGAVKKLSPLCCVRHCTKHASYTHHTRFGGLEIELDFCTKHHKDAG